MAGTITSTVEFASRAARQFFSPPADPGAILSALWWLAIWIACSVAAAKVAGIIGKSILLPIAKRRKKLLDTILIQGTHGTVQWVVFASGLDMAVESSVRRCPAIAELLAWNVFAGLTYAVLVLSIAATVYRATRAFLDWYGQQVASSTSARLDDQFVAIARKTAKFVFLFLALTVILEHFGIKVTGLLATAGVLSLAVAFAAQETLSNMIAGLVLMLDHPFRPGDRVELANGKVGDVLDVGLRTTRILSFDNTVICLPNAEIAKNQLVNLSAPNPQYRLRANLGVAYGSDVRKVKAVLLEILNAHPEVLKEPAPVVYFTGFGDWSLALNYSASVADYRESMRIQDDINLAINDRFRAEGIVMPFPRRDIHIHPG
jgi:MscS family membrane protein